MFRIVNGRRSQLIELQVQVILSWLNEGAGTNGRNFHFLRLERDRVPFFSLNWTIVHPIDEESPLHGVSVEKLERREAEFTVLPTGMDETFPPTVHARSSYRASEVVQGARFVRMFQISEDGHTEIDLRRLFSLIGGMGNAMGGGLGAQFEFYFLHDRFSGFVGVGHVFDGENGEPGGFGNVIGTRVFAGTEKDQAFLGLSLATLTFEYPRDTDVLSYPNKRYGPVLALGFQHAGLGGFTFMLSGGVGYLSGRDLLYIDRWTPRFSFGLGHTWR